MKCSMTIFKKVRWHIVKTDKKWTNITVLYINEETSNMLFYAGIVAITTFLAWIYSHAKGKGTKRGLYVLLVMFPATISGLRGVGTDIRHYIEYASEIIIGTYDMVDYKSIFVQITRLLLRHDVSFHIILYLVSIITIHTMFTIFNIYRKQMSFSFAVFSYMLVFFQMSFNIYRQIMAAALFLLATVYLFKEDDKKKFLIWYIVAVLIHSSILPFGFIFFFRDWITEKKYQKRRIVIYIVLTIIIFCIPQMTSKMEFLLRIIPHYGWYVTRFYRNGIGFGILRYLVMGVIPVVFLRMKKIDQDINDNKITYLPFYVSMGFVLWLTTYISESTIYRISYNLLIAIPILHGYLYRKYIRKAGIIIIIAIIAIMVMFWYYDGAVLNTGETVPYKFFWEL